MISFIGPPNSQSFLSTRIIDLGASSHVCNSLKMFNEYTILTRTFVTLPNPQKIYVSAIGSVLLSKYFLLTNVLYILCFQVNLLSIGALIFHSP